MRKVFLVLVLLLGHAAVAAEPDAARAEAKRLKDLGAQALQRGEYQLALDLFEGAYRAFPSPKLFYNEGLAFKQLGRDVDAAAAFSKFLTDARDAPEQIRGFAIAHIAELAERLGRIDLSVDPSDAMVSLDGKPVGATAIWTTPGAHRMEIRKSTFLPVDLDIALSAGGRYERTIKLIPLASEPVKPSRLRRHLPLYGGGAAVVVAGVGAGLLIWAHADYQHLASTCQPDCPRSSWSDGPPRVYAGYSLLAIGAGLAIADIGLWMFDWRRRRSSERSSSERSSSERSVSIAPASTGLGLTAIGEF